MTFLGCPENQFSFSVCRDAPCSINVTRPCPRSEQLCMLDQTCRSPKEACLCNNMDTSKNIPSCKQYKDANIKNTKPKLENGFSMPTYTVKHATSITVTSKQTQVYTVRNINHNIILPGDVIGFQTLKDTGFSCLSGGTNKWNQITMKKGITGTGFVEMNDEVDMSSVEVATNQTCALKVNYARALTVSVPKTAFDGADFVPGAANITTHVWHPLVTFNRMWPIILQNPVKNFTLLSPTVVTGSMIGLEVNKEHTFTTQISYGTDVTFSWTLSQSSDAFDVTKCPVVNSNLFCASIKHTFTSAQRTTKFKLTAANNVSKANIVVFIQAEEPISGVDILRNNSGVAIVNISETFKAVTSQGSFIHYVWKINGTVLPGENDGTLRYNFTSAGTYEVSITVNNYISSKERIILVEVKDKIIIHGIVHPGCVETGQAEIFKVNITTVFTEPITYEWDFGDGSVRLKTNIPEVTHIYVGQGHYQLRVQVERKYSKETIDDVICVQDGISNVSIVSNSPIIYNRGKVSKIELSPLVGSGTNITYTWEINNKTYSGNWVTVDVSMAAMYQVTLEVANEVSRIRVSDVVAVQEVISGLSLDVNGTDLAHLKSDHTYVFVADVQRGTHVAFSTLFNDSVLCVQEECHHIFTDVGTGSIRVKAENLVSNETLTRYYHVQESVLLGKMVLNATIVSIGMIVHIHVPVHKGTNVTYVWSLCSKCPTVFTKDPYLEYKFMESGLHNVTITAANQVSSSTEDSSILVIGNVTGVEILADGLDSNNIAIKNQPIIFIAVVNPGLVTDYEWTIEDQQKKVIQTETGVSFNYTATESGKFTTTVTTKPVIYTKTLSFEVVEAIKDLVLIANVTRGIPGDVISLEANYSSGTNVTFTWELSRNRKTVTKLPNTDNSVIMKFDLRGHYRFSVTASNPVTVANAKATVYIVEPISGVELIIHVSNPPFVPAHIPVSIRLYVTGGSDLASTWYIKSKIIKAIGFSDEIEFTFNDIGKSQVSVNVSNMISDRFLTKDIIVQEEVYGLTVINSCNYCVEGSEVNFTVVLVKGSDINYEWDFHDGSPILITDTPSVTHLFSSIGEYQVEVLTRNNVSSQSLSVDVELLRPVAGLTVDGCCSKVYEPGETVKMNAEIGVETSCTFNWTVYDYVIIQVDGPTLIHTFTKHGTYRVEVMSKNKVSRVTKMITVQVQERIRDVEIMLDRPVDQLFVDANITFMAVLKTGSDVRYQWTVDDTKFPTTNKYLALSFHQEGNYKISVVVQNDINQDSAAITVEVRAIMYFCY